MNRDGELVGRFLRRAIAATLPRRILPDGQPHDRPARRTRRTFARNARVGAIAGRRTDGDLSGPLCPGRWRPPPDPRRLPPLHWALIKACYRLNFRWVPWFYRDNQAAAGVPLARRTAAATAGPRPDPAVETPVRLAFEEGRTMSGITGSEIRRSHRSGIARRCRGSLVRSPRAIDASRRLLGRPAFVVGPVDGHGRQCACRWPRTNPMRRGSAPAWHGWSEHQNADGGWGDTTDSPSNLATTLLAVAALKLADDCRRESCLLLANAAKEARRVSEIAQMPVDSARHRRGDSTRIRRRSHLCRPHSDELRLGGACRLGRHSRACRSSWPFCRIGWYKVLRLHVVSYALPALIAIGLLLDRRNPPRNPLRAIDSQGRRAASARKTAADSARERRIPRSHAVDQFRGDGAVAVVRPRTARGGQVPGFLRRSQRSDGSWPIDTNLSVWLTTAAVAALAAAGQLPKIDRRRLAEWIAARQHTIAASLHPRRARRLGMDPSCRRRARRGRHRRARSSRLRNWMAVRQYRRRHRPGRAVASGFAERRRRLADVLPRLGKAPVRPKLAGHHRARAAGARCSRSREIQSFRIAPSARDCSI